MYKSNTALLICDLQDKTIDRLFYKSSVIYNTNKLLQIKQYIPNIKLTAISEFISDKLGKTSKDINILENDFIYEKNTYSMVNDTLLEKLVNYDIKNIILIGMEMHWCINNTVRDLNKLNYNIIIPVDCIGNNRNDVENKFNLINLENNGALLFTTDAVICSFLDDADDISSKEYLKQLKAKI